MGRVEIRLHNTGTGNGVPGGTCNTTTAEPSARRCCVNASAVG
jgi:hypothetical protein